MKVGIFGTFDLQNWGDLLFPLIAQKSLSHHIEGVEVVANSYRRKTRANWYYEVEALTDLPNLIRRYDAILIGGGHVVRFDKLIAYGDYYPTDKSVHHPTGYWLLPALLAANAGIPVIWNGPSTSRGLPDWAGPMLSPALEWSQYIAVRDEVSKSELRRFAPTKEVSVVPDTAFGIEQLVSADSPTPEYQKMRHQFGLDRPYVLLQASSRASEFRVPIERARALLPDIQFIEISVGPDIGDVLGVYNDWGLKDHAVVEEWPSPIGLAELVCHSSGVIGTSLHLSLTSLAFGHPVLRPLDKEDSKYIPLREHRLLYSMSRKKAEAAEQFVDHVLSNDFGNPAMDSVKERLETHWKKVTEAIHSKPQSLGHSDQFLMELPDFLEKTGLELARLSRLGTFCMEKTLFS
jgi:hypothetical protein